MAAVPRFVKWLALLLGVTGLTGACSLSPFVQRSISDYGATVEDVNNDLLVTNVLRGGDNAPLSFSDVSQIRGSLTASVAGQAIWPFGPFDMNTGRTNSVQAGPLSLATNPTFDIAPLNTKQFSSGVLESASKELFYYYIRRAVPIEVVLPLLISRLDKAEDVVTTAGGAKPTTILPLNRLDFLQQVETWRQNCERNKTSCANIVAAISWRKIDPPLPRRLLGNSGAIAELVQANAAGFKIAEESGRLVLSKRQAATYVCLPSAIKDRFELVILDPLSATAEPGAVDFPEKDVCNGSDTPPLRVFVAHLRSTQGIFYRLGGIAFDENNPGANPAKKALEYAFERRLLHFHIFNASIPHARFTVRYRGNTYYVPEYRDDIAIDGGVTIAGDYILSVLAMLNDILNLHRDASELPRTGAFQAVGGSAR